MGRFDGLFSFAEVDSVGREKLGKTIQGKLALRITNGPPVAYGMNGSKRFLASVVELESHDYEGKRPRKAPVDGEKTTSKVRLSARQAREGHDHGVGTSGVIEWSVGGVANPIGIVCGLT